MSRTAGNVYYSKTAVKKKKLKDINDIIGYLSNLETELARQSHYEKYANQDKILEWFGELNKITSRLNDFYKTEMGLK